MIDKGKCGDTRGATGNCRKREEKGRPRRGRLQTVADEQQQHCFLQRGNYEVFAAEGPSFLRTLHRRCLHFKCACFVDGNVKGRWSAAQRGKRVKKMKNRHYVPSTNLCLVLSSAHALEPFCR